jgi:hypothetical protein
MRTKEKPTSVPMTQKQSTTASKPVSSPVGRQRRWETKTIEAILSENLSALTSISPALTLKSIDQ